jgi:hypothetical protein
MIHILDINLIVPKNKVSEKNDERSIKEGASLNQN